jgi:hypothetical protein
MRPACVRMRCGTIHTPQKAEVVVSQSPSIPATISGTYVPAPQSQRILLRYAGGESIRSIAREEGRDRATVTKLVRSEQMGEYVQNMKERFIGLGSAAMDALEHALVVEKDSRLAYQVLRDIGVIPSGDQRILPANQEPMSDSRVHEVMTKMASIAIERNRVFGTPTPDVERAEQEIEEELLRQKQEEE